MVCQINVPKDKRIDLNQELAYAALENALMPQIETQQEHHRIGIMQQIIEQKQKETEETQSKLIIQVIRSQKQGGIKGLLSHEKITKLLLILDKHKELTNGLQSVKIELYQAAGDYVEVLRCMLSKPLADLCIHKWITDTLDLL